MEELELRIKKLEDFINDPETDVRDKFAKTNARDILIGEMLRLQGLNEKAKDGNEIRANAKVISETALTFVEIMKV